MPGSEILGILIRCGPVFRIFTGLPIAIDLLVNRGFEHDNLICE